MLSLVCLVTFATCMQGRANSLGGSISLPASRKTDKCSHGPNVDSSNSEESLDYMQDEDMDDPDLVEEIIENLLSGLRDTVCPEGENLW